MIVSVPFRIGPEPRCWDENRPGPRSFFAAWAATYYALREAKAPYGLPCRVTVTRIAPRKVAPENVAFYATDLCTGVALWLHADAADPRITWAYAQRQGGVREYAAEVEIT